MLWKYYTVKHWTKCTLCYCSIQTKSETLPRITNTTLLLERERERVILPGLEQEVASCRDASWFARCHRRGKRNKWWPASLPWWGKGAPSTSSRSMDGTSPSTIRAKCSRRSSRVARKARLHPAHNQPDTSSRRRWFPYWFSPPPSLRSAKQNDKSFSSWKLGSNGRETERMSPSCVLSRSNFPR